ncbi:tyrosine-type recombinase/integrase [Paraburkholderia terricola]|uniref:tyrosine-type recombinase/integrase n=1 Tax=Paraburkholderia terricola TaxID=169427 RepID=UPI002856D7FB|nr:tyrosine-type recombinase/integrase [Paraburkholderia terricola]MDR6484641.1 site-specific recombinase XerD [Paraburkholderia terricola]
MLEELFVRVHARYTRSSHAAELDEFARWLISHGYGPRYAQRLVFRAMCSLDTFDLAPDSQWTDPQLDRAFRNRRQPREYHHARHAFRDFLLSVDRLLPTPTENPREVLIAQFAGHLKEVRGLHPHTVSQYVDEVRSFLNATLANRPSMDSINVNDIEGYVGRRSRSVSRHTLHYVLAQIRVFLDYCSERGVLPRPIPSIDLPRAFRRDQPPRALTSDLIQQFLDSIDRRSRCGWRDFMLFHLMAQYGLRTGETTRLMTDSIDWAARTLRVEQYKTRSWLTLPLANETIDLLRHYLAEGRRTSPCRALFLTATAPDRPMTNSAVSAAFKFRARRSGLPIADASSYSLRHSFAMRLFESSVNIKTIGDLMGHQSLASTAVYLRLHMNALRDVPLPVPPQQPGSGDRHVRPES